MQERVWLQGCSHPYPSIKYQGISSVFCKFTAQIKCSLPLFLSRSATENGVDFFFLTPIIADVLEISGNGVVSTKQRSFGGLHLLGVGHHGIAKRGVNLIFISC